MPAVQVAEAGRHLRHVDAPTHLGALLPGGEVAVESLGLLLLAELQPLVEPRLEAGDERLRGGRRGRRAGERGLDRSERLALPLLAQRRACLLGRERTP